MRRVRSQPSPPTQPALVPVASVSTVERSPIAFGEVELIDGKRGAASCLHCPDAPCVELALGEVNAGVGVDTTHSPERSVCVFGAIRWDDEGRIPVIDPELCTGCGACLGRCPVGALRLDDGTAELNTVQTDLLKHASHEAEFLVAREDARQAGTRVCAELETAAILAKMPTVLASLGRQTDTRLGFGLLVRNLLAAVSIPACASNTGDNNALGDLVFSHGGRVAVTELALDGDAMLDAARRVMTDVAIAHNRRGVPLDNLSAYVVCAEFPRLRSDVYELLANVREVLGLEVRVLPLALLSIAASYGIPLGEDDLARGFLLDRGDEDTLGSVRQVLGDCAPRGSSRFFSPEK